MIGLVWLPTIVSVSYVSYFLKLFSNLRIAIVYIFCGERERENERGACA